MTLWIKFSEDTSLPPVMNAADRDRLAHVFDGRDIASYLHKAFQALDLRLAKCEMLRWEGDAPLINWTEVISAISGGWLEPQDEATYQKRASVFSIVKFLHAQWKVSLYLARTLKADLPATTEARIVESLALGFASMALSFQLPHHDQVILAGWLAQPDGLEPRLQKVIIQMKEIQLRRTRLTSAWQDLFPPSADVPPEAGSVNQGEVVRSEWKGIAVCGSELVGRLCVMTGSDPAILPETDDPLIVVSRRARPETTEFFPHIAAILYAEGGVMSHACTVVRETQLSCITALGGGFYQDMLNLQAGNKTVWLRVNGQTGQVGLVN